MTSATPQDSEIEVMSENRLLPGEVSADKRGWPQKRFCSAESGDNDADDCQDAEDSEKLWINFSRQARDVRRKETLYGFDEGDRDAEDACRDRRSRLCQASIRPNLRRSERASGKLEGYRHVILSLRVLTLRDNGRARSTPRPSRCVFQGSERAHALRAPRDVLTRPSNRFRGEAQSVPCRGAASEACARLIRDRTHRFAGSPAPRGPVEPATSYSRPSLHVRTWLDRDGDEKIRPSRSGRAKPSVCSSCRSDIFGS
ncbi:hypothetical protein HPB47_013762 [Ixodes persulcatus]|uniref:Uncharacterized protein n=1 Tax=Ixodes persulcatus TaxID=34615 RepID=A0AC60R1F8_IXOPE|nr:hypothetical protein HPB47_013762 [Ixodes persulcatus]